jgi:hypothetical protein
LPWLTSSFGDTALSDFSVLWHTNCYPNTGKIVNRVCLLHEI